MALQAVTFRAVGAFIGTLTAGLVSGVQFFINVDINRVIRFSR